jgi:hypothetical protein
MITLDKIVYREIVTDHGHLQITGSVVKISAQHVWIRPSSITGRATRTAYPVTPHLIKVDRQEADLYR